MATDWELDVGNDLCALRAAGILLRNDKILLDHVLDTGEYWLPGGHVQIGETTENALHRELKEELEQEFSIEKLVYVSENFRHWHGYRTNFIEFGYLVTDNHELSDDFRALTADNANVEKVWIVVSDLPNLTTSPSDLANVLKKLTDFPQHFISRDKK